VDFNMIVEVPQGSRNKYEFDPAVGRIRLNRMLFTATRYPTDYGYIPDTLAEDGDPLDAMVLLDEPTFPGCEIHVRSVGVFWMRDEEGPDAKILTVPASDPRFDGVHDLEDIPEYQLAEIRHFFEVYKDLEPGKDTDIRGWQDRAAADQEIRRSQRRAKTEA
jgi:inorganic pyrophosphatase